MQACRHRTPRSNLADSTASYALLGIDFSLLDLKSSEDMAERVAL